MSAGGASALKVLFLGCGGTGGYYGARLIQAGASVSFLVRPARAAKLHGNGLVIQTPRERFTIPKVHTQTVGTSGFDLVFLTCKAYDLDSAMQAISPCFAGDKHTVLIPLLNGVKHYERLDEVFGVKRVLGGCVHIMAELDSEGVVRQGNPMNRITYGLRPGNSPQAADTLNRLHAFFSSTTVDARLSDVIMQGMP